MEQRDTKVSELCLELGVTKATIYRYVAPDGSLRNRGRQVLARSLGLSDVDPVGSLVAGAGEALGLDEGFQQNGSVSVAVLPVLGELTRGQGQQLGGEVLGLDPGKDQETGVVDDQLKVPLPFPKDASR